MRAVPSSALWDTTWTGANGLTFSASRTFYDAGDNALPGWSPAAVRVHRTSSATGTVAGVRDTFAVGHAGTFDMRGIEAGQDTLRIDGGSLDTLTNHFHSLDGLRFRYFHWVSSLSADSVRILKSTRATHAPPISGTMTLVISADRLRSSQQGDVEKHFDATVVVVFNGSADAELHLSSGHRFHWNPMTGAIARW